MYLVGGGEDAEEERDTDQRVVVHEVVPAKRQHGTQHRSDQTAHRSHITDHEHGIPA